MTMKNSEMCRAAMPKIISAKPESSRSGSCGMCEAFYSLPESPNADKILCVLASWSEINSIYYYPTFGPMVNSLEDQNGYTSRIIFLELAALLWEDIERGAIAKPTNQQFCEQLRKAKVRALRGYDNRLFAQWCISDACCSVDLIFGVNAIFDEGGKYENASVGWIYRQAKSPDDITAVFDNSIRSLGETP